MYLLCTFTVNIIFIQLFNRNHIFISLIHRLWVIGIYTEKTKHYKHLHNIVLTRLWLKKQVQTVLAWIPQLLCRWPEINCITCSSSCHACRPIFHFVCLCVCVYVCALGCYWMTREMYSVHFSVFFWKDSRKINITSNELLITYWMKRE